MGAGPEALNFVVFVNISAVLAIVCGKKHTKRKGETTIPTVFVPFGRVQKYGGEIGGVQLRGVVVVVVVVVVCCQMGAGPVLWADLVVPGPLGGSLLWFL